MMMSAIVPHIPVAGVWTSPDGHVCLELRADGRFIETRDDFADVFTGVYVLVGETLKLFEDQGAVVSGTLSNGRLSLGTVEQPAFHTEVEAPIL
ncbi:Atu4866 domain-containing protein [Caulobacter sp. 1776]|uniref:Atu4866 domain-containing protein n=1 Tax=Caulobacter sp. 1776 TaxID=3156420 RepID=UPI003393F65A